MKKALLIAEKPSLAEAIQEGYKHYPNKQYDITYCACTGHLMELYMPEDYSEDWKQWSMDVLPIIPNRFKNKVKKSEYSRYKTIQDNLNKGVYDVIINAGDPAREGELIIDEILKNNNCQIPELRLWTEDLTVKGICKAFDNLLQPQNNLKKAAYLRAWYDQLIGINCSRAISLATGCKISVGRVMSVITAMIVNRDKARANFKPKEYYKCSITIEKDGDIFEGILLKNHNETKFYSTEEIQELMNRADIHGKVVSITNYTKTIEAPLLFNLTELQKEAFSIYGYSPDVVLNFAQRLYEKKLISYPRTDCQYLSQNVASELCDNLKALAHIPEYSSHISKILVNPDVINKICKHGNKYVNNTRLSDHHALITTAVPANLGTLSDGEKNIYMLIARRVITMFMPAKITSKSKIICQFGEISTISKATQIINEGYSELIPSKKQKIYLPKLSEGDDVSILDIEGQILETKPPSYYNYKTLLEDMENCSIFATNEKDEDVLNAVSGIGQSSTRDSVIKKLIQLNYIKEAGVGSKPHLESTSKGKYIVDLLKDSELISVSATARMENKLAAVEKGEYDANDYYFEMIDEVKRLTEQLKSLPPAPNDCPLEKLSPKKSINTGILCPKCGNEIMESEKGFFCVGWSDKSCDYFMKKTINGVTLNLQEFKSLLSGHKIHRRFTWKSGKKTYALLGIEDNHYQFYFD